MENAARAKDKKMRFLLPVALAAAGLAAQPFTADWESLDRRPNPAWFEDAKFGVFICWGLYSVPAWAPEDRYAEWYAYDMEKRESATWKFHRERYGKDFRFPDFAPGFTAELFDAAAWADLVKRSGAKYIVFTTKHHSGYCMWPSAKSWNWNCHDLPPHRDLTGEIVDAFRGAGIRIGLYYSLYEWHNPLYRKDVSRYVDEHMLPQLKDLVRRYKPDLIWPDGEWDHPSSVWRSTEFLAWLLNDAPAPEDVAINDRWGKDCRNRHGGFATPEYGHIPEGRLIDEGRFEECQGMGKSFGYNRNEKAENYRSTKELIRLLIDNVSRGGNLVLDIGPAADGRIPCIMQERLLEMGAWLEVNGEAIYGTEKWEDAPEMEAVRFTRKGNNVYGLCLEWPGKELVIPGAMAVKEVVMIGYDGPVAFEKGAAGLRIAIPRLTPDRLPCRHAWVVRIVLEEK
jgi:alpha-L-fucosidase